MLDIDKLYYIMDYSGHYFRLNDKDDLVIARDMDINGWDIRKALQLLHKSNPTIFEWCASPIVYLSSPTFDVLKKAMPRYFSEKKALYHYWHMAQTNFREYLKGEEVRIKKYFYVLRPLLAAQWILDKRVAPPMLFDELVDAELDEELRPELNRLLEMKKTLPEMGMAPKVQVFNDYIERVMPEIKAATEKLEETEKDWGVLNELFLQFINN